MRSVLFVCFGNTCRSPMMERMLRHRLEKLGIDFIVESAGVNIGSVGQPMFEFSQNELRRRGINADGHMSRHILSIGNVDRFDEIYTVGRDEAAAVVRYFPELTDRIMVVNAADGGVPNPWQQGEDKYREVADFLDPIIDEIAAAA